MVVDCTHHLYEGFAAPVGAGEGTASRLATGGGSEVLLGVVNGAAEARVTIVA